MWIKSSQFWLRFQIKDDQIVITLYKEVARSWVPELSAGGLETQREEEEPTWALMGSIFIYDVPFDAIYNYYFLKHTNSKAMV